MYNYDFSKDDFKVHSFQGREAIKLKKIENIVKMLVPTTPHDL
jgi:hypothetical protein